MRNLLVCLSTFSKKEKDENYIWQHCKIPGQNPAHKVQDSIRWTTSVLKYQVTSVSSVKKPKSSLNNQNFIYFRKSVINLLLLINFELFHSLSLVVFTLDINKENYKNNANHKGHCSEHLERCV